MRLPAAKSQRRIERTRIELNTGFLKLSERPHQILESHFQYVGDLGLAACRNRPCVNLLPFM